MFLKELGATILVTIALGTSPPLHAVGAGCFEAGEIANRGLPIVLNAKTFLSEVRNHWQWYSSEVGDPAMSREQIQKILTRDFEGRRLEPDRVFGFVLASLSHRDGEKILSRLDRDLKTDGSLQVEFRGRFREADPARTNRIGSFTLPIEVAINPEVIGFQAGARKNIWFYPAAQEFTPARFQRLAIAATRALYRHTYTSPGFWQTYRSAAGMLTKRCCRETSQQWRQLSEETTLIHRVRDITRHADLRPPTLEARTLDGLTKLMTSLKAIVDSAFYPIDVLLNPLTGYRTGQLPSILEYFLSPRRVFETYQEGGLKAVERAIQNTPMKLTELVRKAGVAVKISMIHLGIITAGIIAFEMPNFQDWLEEYDSDASEKLIEENEQLQRQMAVHNLSANDVADYLEGVSVEVAEDEAFAPLDLGPVISDLRELAVARESHPQDHERSSSPE